MTNLSVSGRTVLIAIVSLTLGFFINYWSTKLANNKLKEELLQELATLNNIQSKGRVSSLENVKIEQRKRELEAQLKIISK